MKKLVPDSQVELIFDCFKPWLKKVNIEFDYNEGYKEFMYHNEDTKTFNVYLTSLESHYAQASINSIDIKKDDIILVNNDQICDLISMIFNMKADNVNISDAFALFASHLNKLALDTLEKIDEQNMQK